MCKPLFIPLFAALAVAFTTQQTLAADETAATQLPDQITTLDGKNYEKVVLDRVDPDGLLVLFAPAGGGAGAAKLKFRNLPPELRERYGYDAARAADHEGAQARGEAQWRTENAAWAEQRRAAQAEHAASERQMRVESEARRVEAERARAEATRYGRDEPLSYYPWWTPGFYDFGFHGRGFHGKDRDGRGLNIRKSQVSPHMGPMRPSGW